MSEAPEPATLPRILDPLSATLLWERCLRRRVADDVLNFNGVVRQSVQTWQRLREWDVPVSALLSTAGTEDERLFASTAADYSDLLQSNNWTDAGDFSPVLATLISSSPGIAPDRLVLAGFDRVSPSVRRVLNALEYAGCVIDIRPMADRSRHATLHSYPDADAEHRAAGQWARQQLERNPEAKIAIVSPALEEDAEDVARQVREGLVPGWQFGDSAHRAAANLSYGRRVADYPAVAVALQWLRWSCHGLVGEEISVLLRSASLGVPEMGGRSRIERELRTHADRAWRQTDWLACFSPLDESADAKLFCGAVAAAVELAADVDNTPRAPTAWVQVVDKLLEMAGWPGAEARDSAEYQLVNRWRTLLNDFGKLDTVTSEMSWREAVARISALAADTVWQPDRGPGSVAVLGVLEAWGMEFDGIWMCGMDAARWPAPSRPMPYASRQLQRERDMPDATPADTLAFTQRLFSMLSGAAPDCVMSYAETRQDAELTPSALLQGIEPAAAGSLPDPGWSAGALTGTARLAVIDDDPVPAVSEDEKVRGGSYTLQRQSVEPFGAFVHGRLGVRLLDPFWKGLSAGARGIIIHNALHNLLTDKPTQSAIAAWPDIEQRIGSAVDAALDQPGRYADAVLQRLIGLEGRRLRRMLTDFVGAELARDSFVVCDVEKDIDYRQGGIQLGFRIDRIDRLPDGRLLIIDYKTGAPKTFVTRSGELKDLQLVAYADALDEPIGGLLFINVDSREISYRGIGDGWDAGSDNWDEQLSAWRIELHETISALVEGDARIVLDRASGDARPLAILSRYEELIHDG